MKPEKPRTMKVSHIEAMQAKAALEMLHKRGVEAAPGEEGTPAWACALLEQAVSSYNIGVRTHITPEHFDQALGVAVNG